MKLVTFTAALMATGALAQGVATTASSVGASAGGAGVQSSGAAAGAEPGIMSTDVVADPGDGGLGNQNGPGAAGLDEIGTDGPITDLSDLPAGTGSGIDEEAVLDDEGTYDSSFETGFDRGIKGDDETDLGEADDPDTDFWRDDAVGTDGGLIAEDEALGEDAPGGGPAVRRAPVGGVEADRYGADAPPVVEAEGPVLVVPGREDDDDDAGLATEDETTPLTGGVGGDVEPKMIEVGDQ